MATRIKLPDNLPYPITIAQLDVNTGDFVRRGQRLFSYKYWDFQDIISSPEEPNLQHKKQRIDLIGTFDSPVEGSIVTLDIKIRDEFVNSNNIIAEIKQACTHDVTYGGLCAQCGLSVDDDNSSSETIGDTKLTMLHTNTNIKISERQAITIEQSAKRQLRESKKLVLVVDLDQTVIHCGVDPTIGEWSQDPSNPNYEALKDVKSFSLDEEPIVPPFYMGPKPPVRKCWYYVKLRPGLNDFFHAISPFFEMHIYTMATRAYALKIANIIDPDGKLFGDRILSRDENGSLTQKSLGRLFPTDQSMVVIIDDRGDVWNWCNNLIKVVPYNFFIGIGDINSNFLPTQQNFMLHLGRRRKKQDEDLISDIVHTGKVLKEKIDEEVKKQQKINHFSDENHTTKESLTEKLVHSASLEVQQQNRPLAELQQHLHNQRLLIDDDDELPHLSNILLNVHKKYYQELEEGDSEPDIQELIPRMKSGIFSNCHFVFSGLIPLGTDIFKADVVQWTNMFGSCTSPDINEKTTHLMTKSPTTFKARLAKSFNSNIKVVHPDWIFECILTWKRVSEEPYELIVDQPVTDEELEIFKKGLNKLDDHLNVVQEDQKINLLMGDNNSWLDNDEDEMDEFLNNPDDDHDHESDEEYDESSGESYHKTPQYKRTLDTGNQDFGSCRKRHYTDNSTDEGDDDLEAELLQELEH